jgi:hypothetical protein
VVCCQGARRLAVVLASSLIVGWPVSGGPGMTDDQLRELLSTIREIALRPFPPPKGSRNDPELVWALGRIAGIASAVLDHKRVSFSSETA